jgi:hypothetical protein
MPKTHPTDEPDPIQPTTDPTPDPTPTTSQSATVEVEQAIEWDREEDSTDNR